MDPLLSEKIKNPKYKYIHITEAEIAAAREDQIKFPTHKHYVAWRFEKDLGLRVIYHEALYFYMSPNEKAVMYVGELGVALTARTDG